MDRLDGASKTEIDRQEYLRKPFLLPPDVLLFSVTELADHVRERLDCDQDDFAITRPGMRSLSRIVDRETAKLLEEFRQPSPLAEAILRYCRKNALDPYEVLQTAFPVLVSLSEVAFLVPADSPLAESVSASYGPGQLVAGYEVRRLIQVLEDTELYQAQAPDSTVVALKITRPEPALVTTLALRREVAILEHLRGISSPRLVEFGSFRDRLFIATSWLSGVPISMRAQELRTAATPTWRQKLHRLCCRLIDAYSDLHRHGVVHGDIHPRNVLVDAHDSVFVLDYGLSRLVGRTDLEHAYRSGLAWYMEPEMAEAVLREQKPPPASFAGEQYAVAALIYFLICGEQVLTSVAEKDVLYREILDASPPPFTRRSFESWPEVEAVLCRALAKTPQQRYKSMTAFGDAFRQAQPPKSQRGLVDFKWERFRQEWVQDILNHTAFDPLPYDELFPRPPTASIYFGAAGLVWFLYRAAQVREDAHLLAAADLWSRRIMSRIESPGSFDAPAPGLTQEQIGQASLYLRQCGVHYVNALVSYSRGELLLTSRHVQAFMKSLQAGDGVAELLYGRSGILVGGSMMLDILQLTPQLDAKPLLDYLQQEVSSLWTVLHRLPAIGENRALAHLGIAHGWAGILYAQLLMHNALQLRPPTAIHDRLEQLANYAEPAGRGVSWLGTVQHPGQTTETLAHAPGWCSGSAGYVFLWALADEIFREERYRELAEKAAWHAWEHPDRFPNLCCGLTGRAFALLRYYRHTGERAWLVRAQQLAGLAFSPFDSSFDWNALTLSLFRGALGPALLSIELERPERARMPVFDPEGWPSFGTLGVERKIEY